MLEDKEVRGYFVLAYLKEGFSAVSEFAALQAWIQGAEASVCWFNPPWLLKCTAQMKM